MAKKLANTLNGSLGKNPRGTVTPEIRQRMIAEAAYYRALQRGFSGGSAEDDWLQAEQEINRALLEPSSGVPKAVLARASTRAAPTRHENV